MKHIKEALNDNNIPMKNTNRRTDYSKLKGYQRGMTVYCDWRSTYHYHRAAMAWIDMHIKGAFYPPHFIQHHQHFFRHFQHFLISLCHRKAQTIFIPKWTGAGA